MFMRHVPIIGISWKITLIVRVHTLNYIHYVRGGVPPWTILSFVPYLWDFNWEHLIIICSFSNLSMSSDKTQGPIYDIGPSPLQLYINFTTIHTSFNQFFFFFFIIFRGLNFFPFFHNMAFLFQSLFFVSIMPNKDEENEYLI